MWLGRFVIGFVVLSGLAVLGGYFWLQNYLRSDGFRQMVNAKVSEQLEVNAEFDKFSWDGMELTAPNFIAEGEAMIRRIELEGLKTEVKFGPLLRKRVETQNVQARRLHVEVDVTKNGPEFESEGRQAFKFRTAQIDEVSGEVDFGESALKWSDMRGEISPGQNRGSYVGRLSRGTLLTPLSLFPKLDLKEANLRYTDRALILKDGTWRVFESGLLATEGDIDFGTGQYFFSGALENVECGEVVPEDWTKRLTGVLKSDFTVEGKGKNAPLIIGDLELNNGNLMALPVLDRIAAYTATDRFRRLDLRKATMKFRHQGERLELSDIVIVSDGLMRIEGKLIIEGGRLDGDLKLGVTPRTLATIPGASTRVFHSGKDDMLWTPVKITGTTKFPREDLSDRLIAAGFEWMYEMVDGRLVLKQSGKVAGEIAKTLWDSGGKAASLGADIIGQGANILTGVPNPIGPIRNGVGSVIEGILGSPRPKENDPEELPELPGEEKKAEGEEEKGKPKAGAPEGEKQPALEEKKPSTTNLSELPGKALGLLGRELGIEIPGTAPKEEEKKAEEGKPASDSAKDREGEPEKPTLETKEKVDSKKALPKKAGSILERELGVGEE